MGGRLKVQPVTRAGIAPLVEIARHLRSALPGFEDTSRAQGRSYSDDLALDLPHLAVHDGGGFLVASLADEVVAFAVSLIRSRQLVLTQLWLIPELADQHVAEVLLRRVISHGTRSGVKDFASHVIAGAEQQAACFRFAMRPRFPVYRMSLEPARALQLGSQLTRLLPGFEVTEERLGRRAGSGDLERLDRLARGIARPMDHEYWLHQRNLRLATVREGQRIAAYAYGGRAQCGPVAASTTEAGLAALGWALLFSAQSEEDQVSLFVPAVFEAAVEALLEAGAACRAVTQWMSRQSTSGMERYVLAGPTLS
jgi:hypothetical protein